MIIKQYILSFNISNISTDNIEEYLEIELKPILDPLITSIFLAKPDNTVKISV